MNPVITTYQLYRDRAAVAATGLLLALFAVAMPCTRPAADKEANPIWVISGVSASQPRPYCSAIGFPGKINHISSPDCLYEIINVDQSIGNLPPNKYGSLSSTPDVAHSDGHYLLFIRKDKKTKVAFFSYMRDADILWSPDSKAFIVNDYVGSDTTLTYLYRVNDLGHPIDLSAKFIDSITNKSDKSSIMSSIYVHIFGAHWLSPNSIEIKTIGNSKDGTGYYKPFTLVYDWDLEKKSFCRIKRLATEECSSDVSKAQGQ